MTTLVWDGETLATDGRVSIGDMISSEDVTKVFLGNGIQVKGEDVIAWALAGQFDVKDTIQDWLLAEASFTELNETIGDINYAIIVITTKEAYVTYSGAVGWVPIGPLAEGSGAPYATSAMKLGCSATRAVHHAKELDIYTGGTIRYIDCRNDGEHILKTL